MCQLLFLSPRCTMTLMRGRSTLSSTQCQTGLTSPSLTPELVSEEVLVHPGLYCYDCLNQLKTEGHSKGFRQMDS